MRVDDVYALVCRPEGPPNVVGLTQDEANELLWDASPGEWPRPLDRTKETRCFGIRVVVMDIM